MKLGGYGPYRAAGGGMMVEMDDTVTPPILVAAGPREAERRVLAWVEERRGRSAEELWPPFRVVVPSRSLRRHLFAVLVRELGPLAGVTVQTHRELAREVVETAGEVPPRGGSAVQEVLVRRLASEQGALREALGALEDGYAAVAATVRDLVDAGLDGTTLDPAAEAVVETAAGPGRAARARAVLEVARRWLELAESGGLPGRSTLLVRATELLDSGRVELPARGVLIHGFAEATGLLSDLLEALVRRLGAMAVVDLPADPARPGERDAGWRFAERLADRLGGPGWLGGVSWQPPGEDTLDLAAFKAPGPDAEIREMAGRIRALLDGGEAPEGIGVVFRKLDAATVAAVRRHFGRLGIPFSGEGAGLRGGEVDRRVMGALELLAAGGQARVTAWLGAAASLPGITDLRLVELALRSAGVARLDGLETVDLDGLCHEGVYRLPVVTGTGEGEDGEEPAHLELPRPELEAARREGRELAELLARRPDRSPPAGFLGWARRVLDRLGLAEEPAVAGVLEGLHTTLAAAPEVAWDHVEPLVVRELGSPLGEPLGGAGGGVQVLGVMEARSRTFDHLFVAGLNRGVFPRRAREDPLLPDEARRCLAVVLPEIPMAERAPLEERHLFAQLLAAAPRVTLSWRTVDVDGRSLNPSAFVERLLLEGRLKEADIPRVPEVFGARDGEVPRPALEHGTVAGLVQDRDGLVAAASALEDGRSPYLGPLLEELDPPRPASTAGAFLGLTGVGPPAQLWATRLEAYSACPWKQFLEGELGLAEPPEALLAERRLRGLLVGSVVHRVLERIVGEAGAPAGRRIELAEVRAGGPVRVPWPARARLESMVEGAAREVAVSNGVPALAPALARAALPYLDRAEEIEWSTGVLEGVLGAEVRGSCELVPEGGDPVTVRFRADRVDRENGILLLTDYKTGTSRSPAAPLAMKRGLRLQAALYARGGGQGAVGRYVYLGAESGKPQESLTHEETTPLDTVVGILLHAWREGIAVPRWNPSGGGHHGACRFCTVAEACFRDDSSFRLRLERVLAARKASDPGDPLVRLWELPSTPAKPKGGAR